MGLFRRKTTVEDAVRSHLERLGISPFWLRSALDAIHHCEKSRQFEPVFGVAGPAPARSVVALMGLEPFLRGEIDWSISPSESPLWVGSVGDLHDEIFDATAKRFLELYSSADNPAMRPEVEDAIRNAAEEAPVVKGRERGDQQVVSTGLEALGMAGYVWRVAESRAHTTDLNLRADLMKEVEAVVAFCADPSGPNTVGRAAGEIVRRELLLGSGSPGGWSTGGEFLRRGFRFADRHLWPDAEAPRKARWGGFVFGVALFEVDESLARRRAWSERNRRAAAAAR